MAQHDYVIANGTGAAVRSDLNAGFAAIVSQNSGATAPSTTYAYQSWADTSAGVMKMRNGANNAWITLYQLDGEWSTIALENGTAAAPSIYFKDSGTDTGIYSPGADQLAIATGGTMRFHIASSGQSLWGTTSTTGNAFASTATFGLAIDPANGVITNCADGGAAGYFNRTGSDGSLFVFNRNGTEKGNIAVTTIATTYNSISDYRLKENIEPVTDGITRLLQLKPSRFNFIVDPDHTVDGFIAHEAQAVVPECVTGEKDAVDVDGNPVYQGIDQSKLVPLLTAALQEAIARIETLETRLSALEGA